MRADGALVGQCTPFGLLSTMGLTNLNLMQLNVKAHPLKATFDCQRKLGTSDPYVPDPGTMAQIDCFGTINFLYAPLQ
jgi:hypothetical protein